MSKSVTESMKWGEKSESESSGIAYLYKIKNIM